MITIVPPHGDPSLRMAGMAEDEVIDVNALFLDEILQTVGDTAAVRAWGPADRAAVLMRRAGAAALRDEAAGVLHRLRGLGTLLTGIAAPEDGVRLRLDDLETATGTTQSSTDALHAAARPAPYQRALAQAVADARTHEEITVVIERDQQLPAGLWALTELGAAGCTAGIRVTGRFATAYWSVLRTLRPCAGVVLEPAPRGLAWDAVDPFRPRGPRMPWRERAADPCPRGPWAGRVALRDVLSGTVGEAHTVVLGLCADPDRAVGRGGCSAGWPELARALEQVRSRGTRVLAEVWVGQPGGNQQRAADGLRAVAEAVDRVAGFRVFDWPVGWSTPQWNGHRVTYGETRSEEDAAAVDGGGAGGLDLARHRPLAGVPAAAEAARVVRELAGPLARAGTLVPGRVAAAYVHPPPDLASAPHAVDPDVVLGARSRRTGEGVAVNLRTGACTAVDGALAGLIGSHSSSAEVHMVLSALDPKARAALRKGDVLLDSA